MTTKEKSTGSDPATVEPLNPVTTKKAKRAKSAIEKPAAALREDLQTIKNLFERLGWEITQRADKSWEGKRLEGDDPWHISEFGKITDLFNQIFVIENKDLISDLTRDEEIAMLEWRIKGWLFEQDRDLMWSATKGDEYAGKMSDLRPLFSYIEGVETGDHKSAIEKMTTEIVAEQKKKFEDEGWRFWEVGESENRPWTASNQSPAFPEILGGTLPYIFDRIKEIQKANGEKFDRFNASLSSSTEEISTAQKFTLPTWDLPLIQQVPIIEFISKHADASLYLTENGSVEVEYADLKRKVVTSIFFDKLGQKYTKRRPEFGANLSDSILSVEDFYEKFPLLAPQKKLVETITEDSKFESEMDLLDIVPSPFEGQKRRRMRFTDEEISELAASIKAHGVLQPIVVRQIGSGYEIIAGERRFLAAQKAELETIPAVIKNVSDEVAFELQTIENLQRKDPDPIDEAFSYAEYIEKYGRTVEDLSVKFGKPLKFINGRLRLTKLIPEVIKDIADGFLPLGHAFEIAKLAPETQNEALDLCYERNWKSGQYVPDKTEPQTLAQFRSDIEEEIFLSLKKAKFSLSATNLRDDGLPCTKCSERTGATESLFEEMHDPENDCCLNSFCFSQKTSRFVQIVRAEKSAEIVAEGLAPQGYQMPIIAWQPSNREKVEKHFNQVPLVDGDYAHVNNNTGECELMEFGIFVDDGGRFGEVIKICRATDCPKHKGRLSSATGSTSIPGEKSDAEKREFYKRKQEIFDVKVGEPVRKKVLWEAAKTFCQDNWVFEDKNWRLRLVERLWDKTDGNCHAVIAEFLDRKQYSFKLTDLTTDEISRVLFLLIIGNEGEMLWGNWKDQKAIIAVAEEFEVDYALTDAQERVAAAPKKFVDAAKEHLGKIERGEKVARPVFYKLEK